MITVARLWAGLALEPHFPLVHSHPMAGFGVGLADTVGSWQYWYGNTAAGAGGAPSQHFIMTRVNGLRFHHFYVILYLVMLMWGYVSCAGMWPGIYNLNVRISAIPGSGAPSTQTEIPPPLLGTRNARPGWPRWRRLNVTGRHGLCRVQRWLQLDNVFISHLSWADGAALHPAPAAAAGKFTAATSRQHRGQRMLELRWGGG